MDEEAVNCGSAPVLDFVKSAMAISGAEARRLVMAGAVKNYHDVETGAELEPEKFSIKGDVCHGDLIKVGKRNWFRAAFPNGPFVVANKVAEDELLIVDVYYLIDGKEIR